MRQALSLIFILLMISPCSLLSRQHWSVTSDKVESYISQCTQLSSLNDMESELRNHFEEKSKSKQPDLSKLKLIPQGSSKSESDLKYINIDGFRMKIPSKKELDLILRLTSHNKQYSRFDRNNYTLEEEIIGDTLFIRRKCMRKVCDEKTRKGWSYINLNMVKNEESLGICTDVICASKRIFGDSKGVYLLWPVFGKTVLGSHPTQSATT